MKKSLFKKLIALLVPVLVISNLSIPVLAEESEQEIITEEIVEELEIVKPTNLADSDELLENYIEKLAFGVPTPMEPMYQKKAARNSKLSGAELNAYNLLKDWIETVASGETTDTSVRLTFNQIYTNGELDVRYSASDLGVDKLVENGAFTEAAKNAVTAKYTLNTTEVISALLSDLPYSLFWYDKTVGISSTKYSSISGSYKEIFCTGSSYFVFNLAVSKEFAPDTEYAVGEFGNKTAPIQTDKNKIESISSSVTYANSIVNSAKSKNDYDKLAFYKDKICSEVAYNNTAADNDDTPYGNPWQLIYVFDQNNQTNVVCEGYSKAFKFLCDLTSFKNKTTEAHIVTGNMGGGTGAGGHMWNLVSIDGYNYLVDVTNCDEGTIGYSDYLFMRENEVGDADQYTFNINGSNINYIYDDSTLALYDDTERVLSNKKIIHDVTITNLEDKEYTGSEITQSPVVILNSTGVQLIEGTDYILEYENNIEIGTATIRIVGTGSYIGFVEDTFNITAPPTNEKDVANAVIGNIEDQVYTGEQISPTPTVEINGVALVNGTDYEVAYENNTNVGTATIRVVGKGEYEGQKEKTFNITPASISTTEVINVVDKTYTGSEITQALNVMFGNKTLVEGTDYTVSYSNNINVGTATVNIIGKGNYKDTTSKTFKINPVSSEGFAYAVLQDNGDLVFFRSNKGYVEGEGTFTDLFGREYEGLIFVDFENNHIYEQILHLWSDEKDSIYSVYVADGFEIAPELMTSWFAHCTNLEYFNARGFNTINVGDMAALFHGCSSLTALDLSSFDTRNVKLMSGMFYDCKNLTSLDISTFDTSNVTHMDSMFSGCQNLTSLDLSTFDTRNVINMGGMFYDCQNLTSLDISTFDTINVQDISYMFTSCLSLSTLDLSSFDTSNVTDMDYMFGGCQNLTSLDLSTFDTRNVINMGGMFYDCQNLTSLDISAFDTSNVTHMNSMFSECQNLTSLDLSTFDTSNVTDMGYMFSGCQNLTSMDLSSFDTRNVKRMSGMFYNCKNIRSLDISTFDTSDVENMAYMFGELQKLEQINLSDKFINWINDAYLPKGKWSNNNLIVTETQLYNVYPSNCSELAGWWYKDSGISSIEMATITGISDRTYTGRAIRPNPIVKVDGKTLDNGTDYTVSYINNVDVGTATLTITGKGYYTGSINKTFNIIAKSISSASINGVSNNTYTGQEITPNPVVGLDGKFLFNGRDYSVSYINNTNVGTATLTITGKGNYTGSINKTFNIIAKSIDAAIISNVLNKTYTGKAITQKPTVALNGKTLVEGTDYKVSYTNNKNVGTATITITGKGNYTDTVSKTFKINANTKIKLNKTSATIGTKKVGKYTNTLQLKATVTGHNNTKVTWTSSNPKVAKVDKNTGKVTAVSDPNHTVSTVTITAKTVDGKKATCKVTVEDPINAFVRRLYKYCLNRNPDKGGFKYWTDALRKKQKTAADVVKGFFDSKEMKDMKLSNAETIERCYLVMMDRKSDKGGKEYWIKNYAKYGKVYVLRGFVNSKEFTQICKDFNITKGTIK